MIVRTQTDTGSQNKEYRQYSCVDGVQLTLIQLTWTIWQLIPMLANGGWDLIQRLKG